MPPKKSEGRLGKQPFRAGDTLRVLLFVHFEFFPYRFLCEEDFLEEFQASSVVSIGILCHLRGESIDIRSQFAKRLASFFTTYNEDERTAHIEFRRWDSLEYQ